MSTSLTYASVWEGLRDAFDHVAQGSGSQPIVVSSLHHSPADGEHGGFPLVLVPPGRMIAVAIGLRAARPAQPLILVGAADSVTLGTNHLIHAARRNIGMTLVLLRSDLLTAPRAQALDRAEWSDHSSTSPSGRPLEWATALQANFVARSSIGDPRHLGDTILEATRVPGFSVVGVTDEVTLPVGVISRADWPEHFTAYREWASHLAPVTTAPPTATPVAPADAPPRLEVRIAGFGGQGIKLAGTILSEAAGIEQGLWATHFGVYGAATRGGRSRVDVVLGSRPITYPGVDHADVLVLLDATAVLTYGTSPEPGQHVIVDEGLNEIAPAGASTVPIVQLAREHAGSPLAAGVTSLGCIAALLDCVPLEAMRAAAITHLPPGAVEGNLAAMRAVHDLTSAAAGRGALL